MAKKRADVSPLKKATSRVQTLPALLNETDLRDRLRALTPLALASLERILTDDLARDVDKINAAKIIFEKAYPNIALMLADGAIDVDVITWEN